MFTHSRIILWSLSLLAASIGPAHATSVSPTQPGLMPSPQNITWNNSAIPVSSVRISMPRQAMGSLKKETTRTGH